MSTKEDGKAIDRRGGSEMQEQDAVACAMTLKKHLLSMGIWCTVIEIYEESLKFIKIEASIKVKERYKIRAPLGPVF